MYKFVLLDIVQSLLLFLCPVSNKATRNVLNCKVSKNVQNHELRLRTLALYNKQSRVGNLQMCLKSEWVITFYTFTTCIG